MFNSDFYPTPKDLAEKMIAPLELNEKYKQYILDPSAGKGDLLEIIQRTNKYYTSDDYKHHLYACEIEPDLRAVLREKDFSVVADDFLAYVPRIRFTHIIMNPPFSDVENHLLHAWEILYDGELVCLIPTTLTEWKTGKQRIIKNLIDNHGSCEYVGQAFLDAERQTGVEVSIVRLTKTPSNNVGDIKFNVENTFNEPDLTDENKELALNGFVQNAVARYNAALNAFAEYQKQRVIIERYATSEALKEADTGEFKNRWNRYYDSMTTHSWNLLLDHPNFQKLMTKQAERLMNKFRNEQLRTDFNLNNIKAMLESLMSKEKELLDAVILDAFDNLTKYHENNVHTIDNWGGNGDWKHNKAWRVNKKVIVPFLCGTDYRQRYVSLNYHYTRDMDDIDRALSLISGTPFEDVILLHTALQEEIRRTNGNYGSKCQSTFFDVQYYKRGTIHLKFRDEKLLNDFNFRAAKARNWLPPEDTSSV